jgi:toluene monooxygenase system protein B
VIPLVGVFEGDFVAQLFVVEEEDTMAQVGAKMAHHAVGLRVKPQEAPYEVVFNGSALPETLTVREAGIGPMDVVTVRYRP